MSSTQNIVEQLMQMRSMLDTSKQMREAWQKSQAKRLAETFSTTASKPTILPFNPKDYASK